MMRRPGKNIRGVTLLELLVVVAIIGILTMVSVPNIPAIIASHRLRTSANDLMSKLRKCRSLAIAKGRPIDVVVTMDNPSTPNGDDKDYYLTATKKAYIEYNLLAKINDEDFNTRVLAGDLDGIETDLGTDGTLPNKYKPLILFTEAEEQLHLMPIYDKSSGKPDFRMPINYDIQQPAGDNGIYCMEGVTGSGMLTADCDYTNNQQITFTFSPSGTISPYGVLVMNGHPNYGGTYRIVLYKGGQIRILDKR